ncbi:MAG: hypothetical protein AAF727_14585 [Pseudomonadota bacterium]
MTFSRWSFPEPTPVGTVIPTQIADGPSHTADVLATATPDAVHLLNIACLSYRAGHDWIAQRYLFAALVKGCPIQERPSAARLANAEKTLKILL